MRDKRRMEAASPKFALRAGSRRIALFLATLTESNSPASPVGPQRSAYRSVRRCAHCDAHFGMATSASWPSCVARSESGMFLASVVIPSLNGSPCGQQAELTSKTRTVRQAKSSKSS